MKNIVLIGLMGCGKTTIASLLSKELNLPLIDMDNYIEKINNEKISDIFKTKGEKYFRDEETKACKEIGKLDSYIISTGGGVPLRKENIDYLKNNSIIIYINRPVENILNDVTINDRPLLSDGASKLYDLYTIRNPIYKDACNIEILNDSSLQDIVKKIKEIDLK
ncbi:MAG: shikimate kinase [Thomasclavelia sp.]|nr:shikimate kinase [Thomasclavelia sp.]